MDTATYPARKAAQVETELKLLIDPADTEKLRTHPLLEAYATEKPHEQKLVSTYFDTPDLQVRQQQASLRIRQVDHHWVQTFKGGGKVEAGLHQRNEWESYIESPLLDLATLRKQVDADSKWGKLLRDAALPEKLAPVFTTRITRTIGQLRLPGGERVECALDQGFIEYGEKTLPVSELELELKSGEAKALYDFALQLLDAVPMRIGNASKAARGYALHVPQERTLVKAAPLKLSRKMTVEEGFLAIAAGCITHIQGNEADVVHGQDPESVHQMRVGLRRLRSAFKLFEDIVPMPDAMREEFRWVAAQLGAARDWEVLSGSTLPVVGKTAPDDAGLSALAHAASDIACAKRAQAAAAVDSVRYARLMLGFSRWLQGAEWRHSMTDAKRGELASPLLKFADRILVHDQATLLKRGKRLHDADAQMWHRLRIAAKKTRYATEFFQSLYSSKRVDRYVGALSTLQDELGWLNDAVVADGLLREIQETQHDLAGSAGFARGYLTSGVSHHDRHLYKLWKHFTPLKLPGGKSL